ncbi:MAG TPA: alpha/beta fold hydrolase [Acidimicrobiales bacterium]|nr:alpha/beta fold hydrolase [Acidimicrobiales bacterium]
MTPTTKTENPNQTATAATVLPRQTAELAGGLVAYVDHGAPEAPVALFVHGVLVNADLWRNVIWDVADVRRCIAPDLSGHGRTPIPVEGASGADLTLHGHAARLDELCAHLGLDQVDVVANDTGGAVAQVFAARYPGRIRTLTLTNCDCQDNFPPELFEPFVAMAEAGELGPVVAAMASDSSLARSEAGFGMGYATARQLSDELLASYTGPFAADGGQGLERFLVAPKAEELVAVAPLLAALQAPVQLAWGTADIFFPPSWVDRMRELLPSIERVTLVPDAMLFWPDERAADLVPLLRDFWAAHA